MSEATDVLQAIDQLRRDLSGYHGQIKAHNDLQAHCDHQQERIVQLEGLYAEAKAENAKLRELVRMMLRSYDTPDCSACYNKWSCDNHLLSECVKVTECRDRARELGIEVD